MKTHNPTNGDRLRLTPHFTLEEMTRSATARRYHVDNTPSPEAVHNLRRLCTKVLEPLRKEFGPIRVTSGYRSEWLNRMVGGATHSQHIFGEACDIHIPSRAKGIEMLEFIFMTLDYDQLLFEHNLQGAEWIHVSYREGHNRQIMIPYYMPA
ncbi:D-Ala-D-Ala carboxypeptidase family metallohydrolase [Prevotella sp.]|uniref:D-Ala-D-Ala carboxypeptidase family metallohydrolase n=1 Tax=Prevotella sp. TaxID=59823 RepID=UPI002F92B4A9